MTGLVPMDLHDPDVRADTMVELGRRGVPYSVDRNGLVYVPQDRAQTAGMIAGGVAMAHQFGEGDGPATSRRYSSVLGTRPDESPARAAVQRSRQALGIGGRPELLRGGRKAGFGLYRDTREFLEDPDAYGAIMLEPPPVETPHHVHYERQLRNPTTLYEEVFASREFRRAQREHEERERILSMKTTERERIVPRVATSNVALEKFYADFFNGRQFKRARDRKMVAERNAADDGAFNSGPQEEQEMVDAELARERRIIDTILDLTRYI